MKAMYSVGIVYHHTNSAVRRTSDVWHLRHGDVKGTRHRWWQQCGHSRSGLSCGEHLLVGDKSTGIASLLAMRLTAHDAVQKEAVTLLSRLLETASKEGAAAATSEAASTEAAATAEAAAAAEAVGKAASAGVF